MKEDVRRLVEAGLYQDNLRKLIPLCKDLINERPALYGSLIFMFESFAQEYDNQAISVSRYESILANIRGPILLALSDEEDREVLLNRLDEVFRAFATLNS